MFLSAEEIARLTGTSRRSRQIDWLRDQGYSFDVNLRGEPVIARAQVERRQCGAGGASVTEPDWTAIDGTAA